VNDLTTVGDLFAEADRQLTICNACRYCEGYCAVFPALERRTLLENGDITHIADLCHDCRACFTACMYAPPHEFAVNLPPVLAAVRRRTYADYLPAVPRLSWLRGRRALAVALAAAFAVTAALAASGTASGTGGGTGSGTSGSPYAVIGYPVLLVLVAAPCAWSAALMLLAAARYWRGTYGPLRAAVNPRALAAAVAHAATLRYLRGGGADCSYPRDTPSAARRHLHACAAYGFLACTGSTVAAAVCQDILGQPPPYPVLSVPVGLGLLGAAGLIIGCTGLMILKRRADPLPSDPAMTARDYGLLAGLEAIAVTGLLTLLLRGTAAYAPVLVLHLAAVVTAFAIVPYTKFVHVIFRFLALVHDSAERAAGGRVMADG
jgi:citrate/tricarballylate utilization protein